MHCPITLAALDAGKHVLTEARMAMDAAEAKAMLNASRRHPDLVAQVVPSPFTLKVDTTIRELVSSGYLGALTSVEMRVTGSGFPEFGGPLQWRHDRAVSGYNVLFLGVWYEAMMRWIGPAIGGPGHDQRDGAAARGRRRPAAAGVHSGPRGRAQHGFPAERRRTWRSAPSPAWCPPPTCGCSARRARCTWKQEHMQLFGGRRGDDDKLTEMPMCLPRSSSRGAWRRSS